MSRRRRYLVGLGVALVAAIAIAVVVSSRGNDGAEPASEPPAARHISRTAPPRVNWVAEANAVCRLGRKLYPNIVLGAAGETDTVHYAVTRLVTEITAIAALPPSFRGHALERQGLAAVAAWDSLAARPDDTVTPGDKQRAARAAARYVDRLVALGAAACAPLRLRTA